MSADQGSDLQLADEHALEEEFALIKELKHKIEQRNHEGKQGIRHCCHHCRRRCVIA